MPATTVPISILHLTLASNHIEVYDTQDEAAGHYGVLGAAGLSLQYWLLSICLAWTGSYMSNAFVPV